MAVLLKFVLEILRRTCGGGWKTFKDCVQLVQLEIDYFSVEKWCLPTAEVGSMNDLKDLGIVDSRHV